ncbi:uncharacterized protein PHACADRAFT_259339 [Phanerochaete carnosa HHB-10118-sp]|uniref:NEDD8-activating enzyme E1 regulatory subunit n=1 Tax=Phanerochaete carnosa (strain HHB-10118-sp) TaxID=650164 RepID=K5WRY3_PHACS|nr:uncharacterized protein PHACADRAFT_259339 [Phanerochaete carnosa HHB-10118-sp]EKM53152.1 hypothetical protein PHACADRAFT_259339 [Phanerochaete carnosa HHB-10118-sp]
MLQNESQTLDEATMNIQPDNKTRRYDRQLRLWAASGQAALESSRILLTSGSATSTSILKNLVLPGIGHFTILDAARTTPADAGNNFFLNADASIGKFRAEEAVPLLRELNESVDGVADTRELEALLQTDEGRKYLASFTLVITHNLPAKTLDQLASLLWQDPTYPPLIVVRSAGFLADFYIQLHEHCVIESHSETAPSLRLTKPFPALQAWADTLDYDKLDPTEHAHVPFALVLIKEADKWRAEHGGALPRAYAEQKAFKAAVRARQRKLDEENYEEAEAQAVRMWSEKSISSDIQALLDLPPVDLRTSPNAAFHALLEALRLFVQDPAGPGSLPLTSTLPDMKTDTESYVKLQRMYKEQARVENALFKEILKKNFPDLRIEDAVVDAFVKNAHHIKLLRGRQSGGFDKDKDALASALQIFPKETVTHLALSALSELLARGAEPASITAEALTAEVHALVGQGVELPNDELEAAAGEVVRAPTADLPNTAAFLGGMVAQEAIKLLTKQYVPVNGYCVIDLVDSWTGIIGAP